MANNLIKWNQLDPSISGIVAGILGANFANYAILFGSSSGNLGDHVLYVTGGAQTISGQKTFSLSPNVPYSGGSGQAISKLFVTDQIAVLQAQINNFNGLALSGDQTASGKKSFAYLIQASGGIFTDQCLVPLPTNGSGAISLDYLNSIGVVNLSGAQTVNGAKTFTSPVGVPDGTANGHAASLGQLLGASGDLSSRIAQSGGSLDARVHALENTGVNGFAGVLSINGASGRAWIRGCNGISVYQDGNVTRISGDFSFGAQAKVFMVSTPIPTGVESYPISFSSANFSGTPVVLGTLINTTGNSIYGYSISGISSGGCTVYFSAPIAASGYQFNVFAGPSGLDVLTQKGDRGDDGHTMVWRGVWQNGVTYSPLDYVLLSGASYFCATGHLSSFSNNPMVSPTYWNVALSGNGPVGPSGASIKGDKGDKGDGGILFRWRGQWSSITSYTSGDAVYFSGSAYGMTGLYTASGVGQNPFTDVSGRWSLVINGSGIDTSHFYTTDNPSGFITGFNSGLYLKVTQSGLFAASGHQHNYVTGLQADSRVFTGLVSIIGAGNVTVTSLGNSIMISGTNSGISVGGGTISAFNWRGKWTAASIYNSGDVVEQNDAAYFYLGSGAIQGLNSNPLSINNPWTIFNERELTFNEGEFDPNKIYYKNDLAHVSDQATSSSIVFVNTSPYITPLLALNPFSSKYNSFVDCDGVTGYNLFEIKSAAKLTSHPFYNSGSSNTFLINDRAPNMDASGHGTLTLIRGQTYVFDSEIFNDFILTTNATGGTYDGQITGNCLLGTRLSASSSGATPMAQFQTLNSGTMYFTPDVTTPNLIWFQSVDAQYMGWKIHVVDSNPWKVFVSGAIGQKGDKGDQGNAGLAFVWRGAWSNTGFYNSNDAVYYNGSSWMTTQSVNSLPPTENSSAWRLVAKGGVDATGAKGDPGLAFVWKGTWSALTIYHSGEAVYYNGSSYATATTSSGKNPITFNATWFPIASSGIGAKGDPGLAYVNRGDWSSSYNYQSGDAVFFDGGSWGTYTAVTATPPPLAPWRPIALRGGTPFSWRGEWASGVQYYAGDAVFFSGSSYATQARTSGTFPSEGGPWFITAMKGGDGATGPSGTSISGARGPGFNWKSDWSVSGQYISGDVVRYQNSAYVCLSGNSGVNPLIYPQWELFVAQNTNPLFTYRGVYNSGSPYNAFDLVFWDGSTWSSQTTVPTGAIPGVNGLWFNVAFGFSNNVVRTSGAQTIQSGAKTFKTPLLHFVTPCPGTIIDWTSGNSHAVDITSHGMTIGFVNYVEGQTIKVMTRNAGSYTGAGFGAGNYWAGGSAPFCSTGSGFFPGIDVFEFWYVSGLMLAKASLNYLYMG